MVVGESKRRVELKEEKGRSLTYLLLDWTLAVVNMYEYVLHFSPIVHCPGRVRISSARPITEIDSGIDFQEVVMQWSKGAWIIHTMKRAHQSTSSVQHTQNILIHF